ncbi:RNA pyrophosphohydrolase [Amylibacter marinus]|uniref:RNA pyrophosphohydrolase n=1 Tax=Amylibacter marinus TaxID=1475483 RepID=A0ABQ5VWC6_9RHOB|nr:RNA pyrophosphohydrolase [Amylibacter marinus]GLQ35398.1 RNA pyrophosphohydrolase [Amylibacter marinus]
MTEEEIQNLPYRPCVGIMLCNQQGGIFAAQRLDGYPDAWQMPQGGVEKGEDPRAAALRELEEETGIPSDAVTVMAETEDWIPYDLPHHLIPKLWKGRYRGQKQRWFLMRFIGEDSQINIHTKEPEFSQWCWMPSAELLDRIVPFKRATYEQVIRQFQGQVG